MFAIFIHLMIKIFKIIIALSFFFISADFALAQNKVNLYFFYGDGCPHCAKEEQLLNQLEKENENINIYRYEVWNNYENSMLLSKLGRELNLDISGVPALLVGDKSFAGYLNYETTGTRIKSAVADYIEYGCEDKAGAIINNQSRSGQNSNEHGKCAENKELPESIKLPLIGEVEMKNFSLPLLTLALGIADGFNPCAMWTLLFLISLLLGMEDKKRMWILGSVFIAVSGAVYFLFMAAWLNLFLFMGFVLAIRIGIGLVALGSGGLHLYDYYKNRGKCRVSENENRKKVFAKLRQIAAQEKFWLAFAGIFLLACAVNLVELVCSAGLPAVYTQVLALSELSKLQYYGYLLFYILLYMLDDIAIFVIAMLTLRMNAFGSQYARWSGLVGGVLMVIIGVLLLFKPGWLMF